MPFHYLDQQSFIDRRDLKSAYSVSFTVTYKIAELYSAKEFCSSRQIIFDFSMICTAASAVDSPVYYE